MLKDITLGQYFPGNTIAHRLDPRTKILLVALYIVALFISAFRRANDLAMAMEARCYRGGEGRTKMKPLCYEKADRTAYVVLTIYLVVMIVLGRIF